MASSVTELKPKPVVVGPTVDFACLHCGKRLKATEALVGKKVRCPKCALAVLVPTFEASVRRKAPGWAFVIISSVIMFLAIAGCAVYANLSFTVTDRTNFKYFPPFEKYNDANMNRHLGAEYYNIAKAMIAGRGFADPFKEQTGPTAWMPPVLPTILASLLWICEDNRDAVMAVVVFFQSFTIFLTGVIVLLLARKTTERLWIIVAAAIFMGGVVADFRHWFQITHDYWLILFALDVLVVGFCWLEPLQSKKRAAAWGIVGGVCAMINPIVAFSWGLLTIALTIRDRAWYRFGLVALLAAVTISPWVVRNYLQFGRLIPVKSNAAYELWQSQCLTRDGMLQPSAFGIHPYGSPGRERQEYKKLGEIEYLDRKKELFWKSVLDDPDSLVERIFDRFLGAALWYTPFNRGEATRRPVTQWVSRVTHPLPFLALLFLAVSAIWRPLHWAQWSVMGLYFLYLMPYVVVSYYDRYAMPLLGLKVLLVIWGCDRLLSIVIALVSWGFHRVMKLLDPPNSMSASQGGGVA